MKVVLDTGAVSRYISNNSQFKKLVEKVNPQSLCITPVTYIELNNWLAGLPTAMRKQYKPIIQKIPVIDFNKKVSAKALQISDTYNTSKPADTLIAAFCSANKYPLITANRKDFIKIKGVQIIN